MTWTQLSDVLKSRQASNIMGCQPSTGTREQTRMKEDVDQTSGCPRDARSDSVRLYSDLLIFSIVWCSPWGCSHLLRLQKRVKRHLARRYRLPINARGWWHSGRFSNNVHLWVEIRRLFSLSSLSNLPMQDLASLEAYWIEVPIFFNASVSP